MRIGLVSPYSWSFQGGVNRHVEALAEEFLGRGHDVRVLAPVDPPGRISRATAPGGAGAARAARLPDAARAHRRLRRQRRRLQPARSCPASGYVAPRREVRAGEFDVIHVHEPLAPLVGWNAVLGAEDAGGRHLPRLLDQAVPQLHRQRRSARAACSTASRPGSPSPRRPPGPGSAGSAASTRSSPTASTSTPPPSGPKPPGEELRILFVGRPEERKGLPILLTAFDALVEHVPCAADRDRRRARRTSCASSPIPSCCGSIDVRGRVSERGALGRAARRRRALRAVALRRELRHGPDRGLRRRHPGDRLRRSPATATSSPTASTACSSRPATRSASPRSCSASTTSRERLRGDGRRRPPQRQALRLAAGRRPGDDRLRAGDGGARSRPAPAERAAHWAGLRPADGSRADPAAEAALARPGARPRRASAAAASPAASGSASPACSASA